MYLVLGHTKYYEYGDHPSSNTFERSTKSERRDGWTRFDN